MYFVDNVILKIILVDKNMSEDGHVWILGLGSFRVIITDNFASNFP